MRLRRFTLLALAAVALGGCMQTGGSGPFARGAGPLHKQQFAMPAMLRPGARPVARPVVVDQPIEAMPMPVAQPAAMSGIL